MFSWAPIRNFLWCYKLIASITLKKGKEECDFVLIILAQGFCLLKIKITQFPDGLRLTYLIKVENHVCRWAKFPAIHKNFYELQSWHASLIGQYKIQTEDCCRPLFSPCK